MRKLTIAIPEPVWLQSVKVDDPGACGPGRIVFEIVVKTVEAVVRNDGHRLALANGECVHDDFVGEMVDAVGDDVIEIIEIVGKLGLEQLKPTALY